jgi:hypothetical protein
MDDSENEVEARLLAEEAMTVRCQAHLLAITLVLQELLKKSGVQMMDGMKIEDCIPLKSKAFAHEMLSHLADENPDRASKVSKILSEMGYL